MRGMYAPDMGLLHLRLRQLDRLLFVHAHALHAHLEQAAASILIFTSPWLLSMFASEVWSKSNGASPSKASVGFLGCENPRLAPCLVPNGRQRGRSDERGHSAENNRFVLQKPINANTAVWVAGSTR
jgi:hypothetical protein